MVFCLTTLGFDADAVGMPGSGVQIKSARLWRGG